MKDSIEQQIEKRKKSAEEIGSKDLVEMMSAYITKYQDKGDESGPEKKIPLWKDYFPSVMVRDN